MGSFGKSLVLSFTLFNACCAVRADELRYQFTPGRMDIYEYRFEQDAPNDHRGVTSFFRRRTESVDEDGNARIKLYAQLWLIDYKGTNGMEDSREVNEAGKELFANPTHDAVNALIHVDRTGRIADGESSERTDNIFEPEHFFTLQPLPPVGESKWTVKEQILIYRTRERDERFGTPYSRSRGAERLPNSDPADKTVTYSVEPSTGGRSIVRFDFDLLSRQKRGDTPLEHMHGTGGYVFDPAAGKLRSVNWDLVDDMADDKGVVVHVPIRIKSVLVEGDDLKKLKDRIYSTEHGGQPPPAEPTKTHPRRR